MRPLWRVGVRYQHPGSAYLYSGERYVLAWTRWGALLGAARVLKQESLHGAPVGAERVR